MSFRSAVLGLVGTFLALAGGGCGSSKSTAVVVEVMGGLSVPDEVDGVLVEATSGSDTQTMTFTDLPPGSGNLLARGIIVPGRSANASFEVTATGTLGGARKVSQTAVVSFRSGHTRLLQLTLLRECVGKVCPAGFSCTTGSACVLGNDRNDLPDYDKDHSAPPPDAFVAGSDASASRDGGSDLPADPGPDLPAEPTIRCSSQADCASFPNLFCEATAPGASAGACVPRSALHCASCSMDAECGSPSARCFTAPGDDAAACHVDCALAGAAACPSDYTCATVADGTATRQLCRPNGGKCLDAQGGFCDGTSSPQSCVRQNGAGRCTGQRPCLLASGRFGACDASTPVLKASCADLDPPGCAVGYAPAATSTASNCGACGNACPGATSATADVSCVDPAARTCSFSCRGENYDVDNAAGNGCERLHGTPPGHTVSTAGALGAFSCSDSPTRMFAGTLLSDSRAHANPAIPGFDPMVGSAPDLWSVTGSGGVTCVNDWSVTLTTSGGGASPCYRLTINSNIKTQMSAAITGAESINLTSGPMSYGGGTSILFRIEKVCAASIQEAVNYTVTYHL